MKTYVTITDSQTSAEHHPIGDGVSPAEFGALYQAGFEAGHASGREAGYRQGYEAGYRDGRKVQEAGSRTQEAGKPGTAAPDAARAAVRALRMLLLLRRDPVSALQNTKVRRRSKTVTDSW